MIKHEFYELTWEKHGGIVFLKWLPTTIKMMKDDFVKFQEVIINLINAYHIRILFIDGKDFKTKIEKSLISVLPGINENKSSLKWIVYTSTEPGTKKMLKILENKNVSLCEYQTRNELLRVYNDLMEK